MFNIVYSYQGSVIEGPCVKHERSILDRRDARASWGGAGPAQNGEGPLADARDAFGEGDRGEGGAANISGLLDSP